MGHRNYLKKQENFQGLLPSANAIEVIDYYAKGKSPADVQGLLRIDGKKVSLFVIKTVYKHIRAIEGIMIGILDGTSAVYNPPLDEDNKPLFTALTLPTTKLQVLNSVMFAINLKKDKFVNVYDVEFKDLKVQVTKMLDNIIKAQSGSFEDLRDALKPE